MPVAGDHLRHRHPAVHLRVVERMGNRIPRRRLLGLPRAGAAGLATAGAAGLALRGSAAPLTGAAADAVPFNGPHQAGIVTPAQDRLHFVAFDVITADRAGLVGVLRGWTAAAPG